MRVLAALCLLVLGCSALKSGFRFGRKEHGLPPPKRASKEPYAISSGYFEQRLDHFDSQNTRTFQQLYFVNDQYYNPSGRSVAFIFISGESAASSGWLEGGSWITYAQQHGALLFELEHRYYGESKPTPDLSTENMKWLSSEQAVADLASFIEAMNVQYGLTDDVQWIAHGGSYAGSLAAWLRFQYPDLVHGAVSSSGPILAQVDFQDYFGVVTESLNYYSPGCAAIVQQGVETVQAALSQDISTQQHISDLFQLCVPLQDSVNNDLDISTLFEAFGNNFAGVVQYNLIGGGDVTIDTLCDIMQDESRGAPVDRLADVSKFVVGEEYCLGYSYQDSVNYFGDITWEGYGGSSGYRQWLYQTCSEFGYYQTSSKVPQTFGNKFPVEYFIRLCQDLYGVQFNSTFVNNAIDRTNSIWGGLDIQVTNTVFVHGSIDPWHALGIYETRDPRAPAILIEGCAHCANMYPPLPSDPPGLAAAINQVGELITSWLQN